MLWDVQSQHFPSGSGRLTLRTTASWCFLTQRHQNTHRQGITSLPCSRNGTLSCQEDFGNVFPYVFWVTFAIENELDNILYAKPFNSAFMGVGSWSCHKLQQQNPVLSCSSTVRAFRFSFWLYVVYIVGLLVSFACLEVYIWMHLERFHVHHWLLSNSRSPSESTGPPLDILGIFGN